jgi:hypothetical protein
VVLFINISLVTKSSGPLKPAVPSIVQVSPGGTSIPLDDVTLRSPTVILLTLVKEAWIVTLVTQMGSEVNGTAVFATVTVTGDNVTNFTAAI